MKFHRIVGLGSLLLAACSGAPGGNGELETSGEEVIRPTQIGGRNEVVLVLAKFFNSNGGISTRLCSGSYFAQSPVIASRNVGIPLSAETPAPVRIVTAWASFSVSIRLVGMSTSSMGA